MFARIFTISWLGYVGFYLCRKNFSILMPYFKTEVGLSSQDLANALFAYSLLYSFGQFAMGRLVDRIGPRWVAGAGMLVSASLSAAMALPSLAGASAAFAFALIFMQAGNGLAQATGWPSVLKLARNWFPHANRGISMAWWSTHLVVGGFVGTWLAARCAEVHWNRAAVVPALCLGAVATLFLLLARDHQPEATSSGPAAKLRITPGLIAIAAMYFCVKMTRYAFLFWLPLYMTEHLHYDKPQAGYASSAYELIGILGALAAGYLSEHLRGARFTFGTRFTVGAVMMFLLAILCATYPFASASGPLANLAWIGLIGFFTFGPDTLMAGSALQDIVPAETMGSAGGFVNGVGSLGQVLSPFVVAQLSVRAGWASLFGFLAIVVLCGAAALTIYELWSSAAHRKEAIS